MSSEETSVVYERFPERDGYELEIDDYGTDLRVEMSEDSSDIRLKCFSRMAMFLSCMLLGLNIANECWGSKPEFADANGVFQTHDVGVVTDVSGPNMYTIQ
jgi:hypothetical protein